MNEIKMNTPAFDRAMAKAVETKPLVKIGKKDGQYFVAASDGFSSYVVQFQTGAGGRRLASCLCAGGQKGLFCYHQAAALLVHSSFVRAGLRRAAPSRPRPRFACSPRPSFVGSESVRNLI